MIWWWVTMLLRSIIICWLLVALGHTFILEQPGGSAFRHFPQWRFFCKYIAVDSWDWHQIFCYFFGDDFKDVISNSRTQDDMQKHAANCKPKHCQCGTSTSMSLGLWSLYTKNIFIRFFFWCLRLLNNSPQRMFRTNQWPPRCTDMEYGWDITAVPLAKEHLYGRIVLLHKNSAWKIDEGECQNVSETDTWNECLKGHQKVKGIQRLSHVYEPIL